VVGAVFVIFLRRWRKIFTILQPMGSKGRTSEEMSQSLLTNKKQGNLSSQDKSITRDSPFKPSLFKDYAAYPKLIANKKKNKPHFFLTVNDKDMATVLTNQRYSPFLVMKEWEKL